MEEHVCQELGDHIFHNTRSSLFEEKPDSASTIEKKDFFYPPIMSTAQYEPYYVHD